MADPLVAPLSAATTIVNMLATANHPVLTGMSAVHSLPTVPTVGAPFSFAAALAGREIKDDQPQPSEFSRVAVDSGICAWLLQVHEYLTISGIRPKVCVIVASNFLDKAPLQLWEACKPQLVEQPEMLYQYS